MNLIKKIIKFLLSKKFIAPIVYIIMGILLYTFISFIITRIMKRRSKKKYHRKQETVINLIKNIIKYLIIIIIVIMTLDVYGINTTSILASLGIVSVVVGLAFQDTMKNMLAGILIILDNRYSVGDLIDINGFMGTVQSLGLQTTKIKSATGESYTISNSNITSIINYSENDAKLVIDLAVGYNTDIDFLEKVLKNLSKEVVKLENVLSEIELMGLDSFGQSELVYKIGIMVKATTQYGLKRKILKMIKKTFDENNIEIPYSQVDVHLINKD